MKENRKMEAASVTAPHVTVQVCSFVPGSQSGPEEHKVLHPTEGPFPSSLTRGAFLSVFHTKLQETGKAKPGDIKGKKVKTRSSPLCHPPLSIDFPVLSTFSFTFQNSLIVALYILSWVFS